MRLAKIAKLVSKSGLCDVYGDEHGTGIYIGVGNAIYHVQNLPMPCAGDQMRIMLDIPTKKWEKVSCVIHACPPPLDMAHTTSDEMLMTEYTLMTGSNYLILVDEHSNGEDKKKGKLAFVDDELLVPMRGEAKEYIGYACRFTADGCPYIIIKDGMYAIAAVAPVLVDAGKVAEQLAQFQSICLDEAERKGREGKNE
nr:MAG TPA: hypothetical protein [Caudoviricetes sp.]